MDGERGQARTERVAELCRRFGVLGLYAFGSRAREVQRWMAGGLPSLPPSESDVDIGVKVRRGALTVVKDKVALQVALEDLLQVGRVDLVVLDEADPFLAANVIRGERLYAEDGYLADEYDLYILRRAGDLAPLERERMELILRRGL